MSFMSLKLLATVAVVIGKTKAIEARCSRLGRPAFRVSFCKRLVRTDSRNCTFTKIGKQHAACLEKARTNVRNVGFLAIDILFYANLIGVTS